MMDDLEERVEENIGTGNEFTSSHRHSRNCQETYVQPRQNRSSWYARLKLVLGGVVGISVLSCAITSVSAHVMSTTQDVTAQQINSLLNRYGWHASHGESGVWKTQLPKSYDLQPGMVPTGLYWAYHNELSKAIGLDITPYLGQSVIVHTVPLKENWRVGPPEEITYGIIIVADGGIIGAWAEKGVELHFADMCESLNHKEFGDLVKQSWGAWTVQNHLVNYADTFYSRMAKWTPKQLLQAYFSAVNKHQDGEAYAMTTTSSQYQEITMNVPVGHLYNTQWDWLKNVGLSNWKTAKFISMKPYHYAPGVIPTRNQLPSWEYKLYNMYDAAQKFYTVKFHATFRTPGPLSNGPGEFYTTVTKEVSQAPWTIGGFGTGP